MNRFAIAGPRWVGLPVLLVLAAAALWLLPSAEAKKEEVHESVAFAKSWDAAVEEAKLLNVPIVVHSHGFFCGPCWGMHSALLLNEKYIEFANDNTVEFIALQRLQEGIDKGDKRAETYEVEVAGQTVKYLKEFPGMTVEDMERCNSSKASSYNDTGAIPYTCLVDPWTQEKGEAWKGSAGAGAIMDAVTAMRKTMEEAHGKGFPRKDLRKIDDVRADVEEALGKQDFAKAVKLADGLAGKIKDAPEAVAKRVEGVKQLALDAAKKALDDIEALEDKKEAKKQLVKIKSKFKGTGMEERAETLYASLG